MSSDLIEVSLSSLNQEVRFHDSNVNSLQYQAGLGELRLLIDEAETDKNGGDLKPCQVTFRSVNSFTAEGLDIANADFGDTGACSVLSLNVDAGGRVCLHLELEREELSYPVLEFNCESVYLKRSH